MTARADDHRLNSRLFWGIFAFALIALMPISASAITLGPGDIVVVDRVSDRVIHVDPDTGVQTLISSAGGGHDVVIDDTGRIFITESNDLIEVNADTGVQTFIAENVTAPGNDLHDLALTPSGDIVVSSFTATPHLVDVGTGTATPIAGISSSRVGVAIDAGGDLYFAAEVSDEIRRYTSTGTFIQAYPLFGVPPNAFGRPGDVAFTPSGELIVTDRNEELFIGVDTSTGVLDVLGPISGFEAMSGGIAVEASGDYVLPAVETGMSIGIYRVDATTGAFTQITSGGFLSLGGGVTAVAVAPSTLPEPPGEEANFLDCPASGSALTDPIILCANAIGTAGPAFDAESGFASNIGLVNETQSSVGAEATGDTDIDSELGYAEIFASADKVGTTDGGEADVSSGLSWEDEVTINALGYPGENGRFKAVFMLLVDSDEAATLGTGASVLAETSYSITVGTDETTPWSYEGNVGLADSLAEGPMVLDGGDPSGVYLTGFHDFVFGTPFQLDVDFQLRNQALADGTDGSASSDAHVRLHWLGITDIQAITPLIQPVPDIWLSNSSVSGVDWRQAQGLPEPGLLTLIACGGLGLALFGRGRGVTR